MVDLADNSEFDLATSTFVSMSSQTLTFTPTEAGIHSLSVEYGLVDYPVTARA